MSITGTLCIGKICVSAASIIGTLHGDAPLEHLKEIFEAISSGGEAVKKLRGPEVPKFHDALKASQKTLERAYAESLKNCHSAGFADTVDLAFANLSEVFDTCVPRGQELARLRHDPEAIANHVADAAVAKHMDVFAAGEGRKMLIGLVILAYTELDKKPEFMTALARVNWKETFEQLASIKEDTAAIRMAVERLTRDLDLTESARRQLEVDLATVRTEYGGTVALVGGFLQIIVGQNIPPEQFAVTLMQLAANWQAAGRQIDALSASRNLSPKLAMLRDRLAHAYRDEQVEAVEALLAEVAENEQTSLDGLITHQTEVMEEIALRREGLAATRTAQANLALAALRYDDAARLLVEALALENTDQIALFNAIRVRQDEFYIEGRDKGSNAALEVSIAIAKLSVDRAVGVDQRGEAVNDLAVSLMVLGERETGTARLEEAVTAHRAALEERTRERVPLDWAMTQNNLGNALQTLGARESGTTRLEEAVTAYRAALEEYTRERAPLRWATTQNNLGAALQTLGERETGTARLEEAVTAYRAALEERTRERVPLDWATTQNNLGNALQTLGARESGTARLEEAVTAYRAALEEYTRERAPLQWATTQNNLGAALQTLGARESGTARLEEAVTAYRAALEERTRERVPLDWAATQSNLGAALQTLGARESGTARLEEAVTAYRAALEECTRERVPLDWAMTQNNLGNALSTLGERESGTERLEAAVTAYRAALEEWTLERAPYYSGGAQGNLDRALALLRERRGDNRQD